MDSLPSRALCLAHLNTIGALLMRGRGLESLLAQRLQVVVEVIGARLHLPVEKGTHQSEHNMFMHECSRMLARTVKAGTANIILKTVLPLAYPLAVLDKEVTIKLP